MGLFGKRKNEGDFDIELSSYSDVAEAGSAIDKEGEDNDSFGSFSQGANGGSRTGQPRSGYGIQDAIELMRKLPNVNSDIVVTVVRKTLESANIQVNEIVSDAQKRETEIEDRSDQLIMEIEKLESKISELNEEITELNAEIEETTKVKDLLLTSMAQDESTAITKSVGMSASSKDGVASVDNAGGKVENKNKNAASKAGDGDRNDVMDDIEAVDKHAVAEKA